MKQLKAVTRSLLGIALALPFLGYSQNWKMQPVTIKSRWAKDVSPNNALKEYPCPQLVAYLEKIGANIPDTEKTMLENHQGALTRSIR